MTKLPGQLAPRTGAGKRASAGSSFQYENQGDQTFQLQVLKEQLEKALASPSAPPATPACTECMQAHTSPTVHRHKPPGAQSWLRNILTLGC